MQPPRFDLYSVCLMLLLVVLVMLAGGPIVWLLLSDLP